MFPLLNNSVLYLEATSVSSLRHRYPARPLKNPGGKNVTNAGEKSLFTEMSLVFTKSLITRSG